MYSASPARCLAPEGMSFLGAWMEEADMNDVLVFIGDVQPESLTEPKTEQRHPKLYFAEYTSQRR